MFVYFLLVFRYHCSLLPAVGTTVGSYCFARHHTACCWLSVCVCPANLFRLLNFRVDCLAVPCTADILVYRFDIWW